jgi:hypothetical protein
MCHQSKLDSGSSDTDSRRKTTVVVVKKRECFERYMEYVRVEGSFLNSSDVRSVDPTLYRTISSLYGSWVAFYKENAITPRPARRPGRKPQSGK